MKKKTGKQIAAIVGIVVLVLLYLFTLIAALLDFEGWDRLFQASLVATIGVPILLWIYIWLYGKITNRHTMASFDMGAQEDAQEAKSTSDTPSHS